MHLLKNIRRNVIATMAIGALAIQADGEVVHVAKKGETIYGIANMYHISPDALLNANPQAQKGVKKGMSLVIPDGKGKSAEAQADKPAATTKANNTATAKQAPAGSNMPKRDNNADKPAVSVSEPQMHTKSLTYLSSDGDTFEVISRKTGVESGELMELNPFLDPNNIPGGTLVRLSANAPVFDENVADETIAPQLPSDNTVATVDDNVHNTPDEAAAPGYTTGVVPDTYASGLAQSADLKNILIMLPFMSESDTQPKKAHSYTDFYRGFLLAAKNNVDSGMRDIDVIVADTNGNMDTSRDEVASYIDHDVAVIIAPEDHAQIQMLADSAATRGAYVLNMFNFTDDTYAENPWAIQGNINQALMYDKAIDAVISEYPGYVPVILKAENSREEKAAFTDALKERYRAEGNEIIEISFDEALADTDLTVLDRDKRYVFIPRTGSQTVFNRFAPALLDLISADYGDSQYELFGYPDWTAYRGESLSLLQRLRACVYSRFACDESNDAIRRVQEEFINWYGEPMLESVPSQALLGYDVANFLIQALRSGSLESQMSSGESYEGLQSTFKFKKTTPDSGFVNEALYLIKFLPDDRYSIKTL